MTWFTLQRRSIELLPSAQERVVADAANVDDLPGQRIYAQVAELSPIAPANRRPAGARS